jgi:hypothetical protein
MLRGPLHLYIVHCFFSSYCGLDCIQHLASTLAHSFKTLNLIYLFFKIDYSYFSHVFSPSCSLFINIFFVSFCSIQSLI